MFPIEELQELPSTYNYPLHLLADDVSVKKPRTLEELVTLRHEGFYKNPDWLENIPAQDSLKKWLTERVSKYSFV
jgi:hypothetical protein